MIFRNVDSNQMNEALAAINDRLYKGNVKWNNFNTKGRGFSATLRVENSSGPGARRSHSGRKMISACWHVHGNFFDAIFAVAPDAVITSAGKKITADSGNWVNWNAGSMMHSVCASELCECEGKDSPDYSHPDYADDSQTAPDYDGPEILKGKIVGFAGSYMSGIAQLMIEDEAGQTHAVACENGATVRALEGCFGNVIGNAHNVESEGGHMNKWIYYSMDDMGLVLGGFTPVDDASPELEAMYESSQAKQNA